MAGATWRGLADGPVSLATGQILAASLLLLPLVLLSGVTTGPMTSGIVLSMIGLGALGTGVAYVLNYRIVRAAGATTASTVTYLTPLVAILVGLVVPQRAAVMERADRRPGRGPGRGRLAGPAAEHRLAASALGPAA